MPEGLAKLWGQLKDYWNELEKDQRMRLYIAAAILVVVIVSPLLRDKFGRS